MIDAGVLGAIAAAALLGFRHGVDYDHVAAIADLTGTARRPVHAVALALCYGLGHSAIIGVLGALSVAFGLILPRGADRWLESAVGCTLVVLGAYVLSAIASGRSARPATRFEILRRAARWARERVGKAAPASADPDLTAAPTGRTAFGVGIIHGIGAETPTQLGLFVLSAGVGGWGDGLLCVAAFAGGLLAMNALMAAVSAGMFHMSSAREPLYRAVMMVTGAYSLAVGALFILSGLGVASF
jgi:high-affinity nickel permease